MPDSSPNASVQFRQDSSVEPRAYRPTRWPPSNVTAVASPSDTPTLTPTNNLVTVKSESDAHCTPRRFPRSLTAPITRYPQSFSSTPSTSEYFGQSHSHSHSQSHSQSRRSPPVLLSPGLSPLLRDILPHPKAVRPRPFPTHSDLSAASTRAEQEPTALRDLRRVTAPPALLDPAHYEYEPVHPCRRDRDRRRFRDVLHDLDNRYSSYYQDRFRDMDYERDFFDRDRDPEAEDDKELERERDRRFRSSASASSLLTDRMSEGTRRDRWSLLTDVRRSRSSSRSRVSKFTFRKWLFSREKREALVIPDRLRDFDQPCAPDRVDAMRPSKVFRNDRHPPDDPLPHLRRRSLGDGTQTQYAESNKVFTTTASPIVTATNPTADGGGGGKIVDDDVQGEGLRCSGTFDSALGAHFNAAITVDAHYSKDLMNDMCSEEERVRDQDRQRKQLNKVDNMIHRSMGARRGHSLTHLSQRSNTKEKPKTDRRLLYAGGMFVGNEPAMRRQIRNIGQTGTGHDDHHEHDEHEHSVISALTNESDEEEGTDGTLRTRSISEAVVHRRLSLVHTKDKMISVWDRLLNRRRSGSRRNEPKSSPPERNMRSPWLRFLFPGEYVHG